METNQKLANSIQEMPAATLSRDPGFADVIGARRNWTWVRSSYAPRVGAGCLPTCLGQFATSIPKASWRDLIEDFLSMTSSTHELLAVRPKAFTALGGAGSKISAPRVIGSVMHLSDEQLAVIIS